MIREQNPHILVIATHPDSHYLYCRLAAEKQVPVVICEKPLADTLSAAKKIAALCGAGKRPGILTNHERRYSADYIKAKEILASEKLGELLSVRAVLYMGKNKRLLDVFWHDGTHLADAAMFLTGRVLKHRKNRGAKLKGAAGTAWLEGELTAIEPKAAQNRDAIPFVMEVGAGRDHLVFELEFSCAKGRLRIGNGVFEVWESDESPYAEKFRSLKKTTAAFEGPTGYFANMIADAVSCVREKGRQPLSQAADGLAAIEYLNSVKPWL
jgi:predicted dehydrogenase